MVSSNAPIQTTATDRQNRFELQAELKGDEKYSVWTNPDNHNRDFVRKIKSGVNGEYEIEAELINGS